MKIQHKLIFIFIILIIINNCEGDEMKNKNLNFNSIESIPEKVWDDLSKKNIYFGHQSVGENIISGIKDIIEIHPNIKLNIVETRNLSKYKDGILAHSEIGRNNHPLSKLEDFEKVMKNGIGENTNIAFFKFCFADIVGDTNIIKIFDEYKNTMARLEKEFPKTKIVHVTVPLLSNRKNFKVLIKKIIGKKDLWGYDGNLKRNNFNEMLRKEYKGKKPFFDLAMIEATNNDKSKATFKDNNKEYYYLIPEYTDDGGHLNSLGQKIVGEKLLLYLSSL